MPADRVLAAAVLVALCSGAAPAQPRPASWSFVIEQRYGLGPGAELVSPTTIAVDGAGRLYVADARPAAVKVFRPDGTLLRVVGRAGGGPGEYRNPWIAARGANLVVHDPAQSRTSVFDTSGAFRRSWQSFCCHQNEVALDRAGRIVVPAVVASTAPSTSVNVREIHYVRYRLDGSLVDTVRIRAPGEERLWTVGRTGRDGKPGTGTTSVNVPFTPRQLFAWDPAGGYVSGWSGEMRLFRSGGRDSTALLVRREPPGTIPDSMRRAGADSAIQQLSQVVEPGVARAAVRLVDVPTHAPAFTRLLVDEAGSVWARLLIGAGPGETAFRVFSAAGADLGTAVVPAVIPAWGGVAFGPGMMYVRSEDVDGQPIVLRIRITRGRA